MQRPVYVLFLLTANVDGACVEGTSCSDAEAHVALVQRHASSLSTNISLTKAQGVHWCGWVGGEDDQGLVNENGCGTVCHTTYTLAQCQADCDACGHCQGFVRTGSAGPNAGGTCCKKMNLNVAGRPLRPDELSYGSGWELMVNERAAGCNAAPAPAPAPGPASTAVGDPHLVNARGEHFSIFTTGAFEFIRVPFDSTTANAEFAVQAIIESMGQTNDKCKNGQYITGLLFSGSKFHGKSLEVHVDKIHPGATRNEIKVLLEGVGVEPSTDTIEVGDKMTLEMPNSNELVLHVDGASVTAKLQYYFLNVEANSFSKLASKIGGLLGEDEHAEFSMKPAGCDRKLIASAEPVMYSSARMTA